MAQTKAEMYSAGVALDYTPVSAVTGGDIVVIGSIPLLAVNDIAAAAKGSLQTGGVWKVPKATGALTQGDSIYWHTAGSPVTGTASSGAADGTASGGYLIGMATADALSGDSYVYVLATSAKRTATIAGSVTADDITGSDSSLGVAGLAAAQGGAIVVTGGTSSTGANAGGAVSLVGGTPGTTGVGGAASVTGGIGGATSGTGGAVTLAGGAATGTTAVGGLASVIGGASAGASGTAGVAKIDAGSAAGGTGAAVLIADVNATATYINRGPLKAPHIGNTLTALGTTQSSTPTSAQLLGGMLSQTGSTGAGTVTLPTGTALSTACARTPVVGDTFDCAFYNLGGSQTLTITGATGTTVIGTAAVGTGKMATMKFYNSGSNTWNIYVIVSA